MINFDGPYINLLAHVDGEDNLRDGLLETISATSINLVEGNGGAVATLPGDFEGTLGVFGIKTDYFFSDQLVRTGVNIEFSKIDAGTDYTAKTLALAQDVTQTEAETGLLCTISDGSLIEAELLAAADGVSRGGLSYVVSATEYDGTRHRI